MNIAVDAMGGDNAPFEVVKGVYDASLENSEIQITLIGDETKIKACMDELNVSLPSNVTIVNTDVFVTSTISPLSASFSLTVK